MSVIHSALGHGLSFIGLAVEPSRNYPSLLRHIAGSWQSHYGPGSCNLAPTLLTVGYRPVCVADLQHWVDGNSVCWDHGSRKEEEGRLLRKEKKGFIWDRFYFRSPAPVTQGKVTHSWKDSTIQGALGLWVVPSLGIWWCPECVGMRQLLLRSGPEDYQCLNLW